MRGIFGAMSGPAATNVLEFITIATTGNAQDFGDLNQNFVSANATSNSIRYVVAGGTEPSNPQNAMSFVMISTTGNGSDFGDLTVARFSPAAASNGHGGL